jgi:hypothetical protein
MRYEESQQMRLEVYTFLYYNSSIIKEQSHKEINTLFRLVYNAVTWRMRMIPILHSNSRHKPVPIQPP